MKRTGALLLTAAVVLSAPTKAFGQTATAPDVNYAVDGAITIGAAVGAALFSAVDVDRSARWNRQLLPFDEVVKRNFSHSAAKTSDMLATITVLTPMAVQVGHGIDEDMGKRSLVYGETLAITFFLNSAVKYLVGRPRPYVYNPDPLIQAQAEEQGKDSHLSFYSGHSAGTFAAAVAGSYLFAQTTTDRAARTVVWGLELSLAAATANLRVRAGKHFYSDVIVGTLLGAAVGWAVPYLHGGAAVELGTSEWIAIGVAPVVGALVGQVLPFKHDIIGRLDKPPAFTTMGFVPWVAARGGGLLALATF